MKKKLQKFSIYISLILFLTSILLYQETHFVRGIDPFVGDDPIIFILEKYKNYHNHQSIIAIKKFCHEHKTFNFETIKGDDVLKKIKYLDRSKTSQNGDVPTEISKENAEFLSGFIYSVLNEAIQSGNFPSCLK